MKTGLQELPSEMATRSKEAARLTKENMREAKALAEDVEKVPDSFLS